MLWSPASDSEHAPLVLMGHGGGLHKKTPGLLARARHVVTTYGFTVAAIDAPGHGVIGPADKGLFKEIVRQYRLINDRYPESIVNLGPLRP